MAEGAVTVTVAVTETAQAAQDQITEQAADVEMRKMTTMTVAATTRFLR